MIAPSPPPAWLVPWTVWVIRGKVDPRPDAPTRIPDWAIWFPAWCKWRMAPVPKPPRPAKAPTNIKAAFPDAYTCLAQVVEALRQAEPEPPPVEPIPAQKESLHFWRGMSCWVTRIDHFPPFYVQQYCGTKYRLVIMPTLRGTNLESYPDGTRLTDESIREYVTTLQRMGYRVAGSQWGLAVDPVAEAEVAAEAVLKYGFNGWAMNGEKLYEGGGKSAKYAIRFREAWPSLPFLWTPEPRIALDHKVLQALSVAYGPQAYALENFWGVASVMDVAVNEFGYAPENVVPLIQAYKSPSGDRYPATRYRDDARATGAGGLCLYTANQAVDVPQYWTDLAL